MVNDNNKFFFTVSKGEEFIILKNSQIKTRIEIATNIIPMTSLTLPSFLKELNSKKNRNVYWNGAKNKCVNKQNENEDGMCLTLETWPNKDQNQLTKNSA